MVNRQFIVNSIGEVRRTDDPMCKEVIIYNEYEQGLEGIEEHVNLVILWWLHYKENDRDVRQFKPYLESVIPQGKRRGLELHGVFSSRAPLRPNPIALTVVQLVERKGNVLRVRGLDAYHGSPVLDIKPHFLL